MRFPDEVEECSVVNVMDTSALKGLEQELEGEISEVSSQLPCLEARSTGTTRGRQFESLGLFERLCEMHEVVFEGGEKRLKITQKIIPATVARISQESNVKIARFDHSDKDPPEAPTQPSSNNPTPPSSAKDSVSSCLSSLESMISLVELTQHDILEELRLAQKSQKDVWKYMEAQEAVMQRPFRANTKRLHTFPEFPTHVLDPFTSQPTDDTDIVAGADD
ncbi:hypothetical protein L484_009979 [Morus notabilis]|uniref:Uncharacterized protein n=1 Tax=Morus notabilis TaxID=981085 RepID=W9S515_9ROSA|nr:hypothetical protein L484_009979 [Morus notabilis]